MQSRLIVRADSAAMRQVESFVAAFVKEQGIAADDTALILILLEELLTNLAKYGYSDRAEPGRAEIALALSGSRLEIEFIDDGCAFDPLAVPLPNLDEAREERPVGGLGLHLLRSLADGVSYERSNNKNVIRLSRSIASTRTP
jgi:serine/threonine-protein kinase RsbW